MFFWRGYFVQVRRERFSQRPATQQTIILWFLTEIVSGIASRIKAGIDYSIYVLKRTSDDADSASASIFYTYFCALYKLNYLLIYSPAVRPNDARGDGWCDMSAESAPPQQQVIYIEITYVKVVQFSRPWVKQIILQMQLFNIPPSTGRWWLRQECSWTQGGR